MDALYEGGRVDDEPRDARIVSRPARVDLPAILGGNRPRREPWHQQLVEQLYADSGDFS